VKRDRLDRTCQLHRADLVEGDRRANVGPVHYFLTDQNLAWPGELPDPRRNELFHGPAIVLRCPSAHDPSQHLGGVAATWSPSSAVRLVYPVMSKKQSVGTDCSTV
jgi:hypothetical protein